MSMCKCDCGEMGYLSRDAARRAASRLAARTERHVESRLFGAKKTSRRPGRAADGFHGRRQHFHSLIVECERGGLHVELPVYQHDLARSYA